MLACERHDKDDVTLLHNVAVVKLLLRRGVDVNAQDEAGDHALSRACYHSSEMTRAVLGAYGVDPNLAGSFGNTALVNCIEDGLSEPLALLLSTPGVWLGPMQDGVSPLMIAAGIRDSSATQALLAAKADANYADPNGATALHVAVARENVVAVRALLAVPLRVHHADNDGVTAEVLAQQCAHPAIAELLSPALDLES